MTKEEKRNFLRMTLNIRILRPVLVRVTVAVIKHHDQNDLRIKWLFLDILSYHCFSLKEVRIGS